MNRKKRLAKNISSSLIYQITVIVCGFILPRLILVTYGSSINGLVNSISQFMQLIAFLELGVGSVVESALYKPIAERNKSQIDSIVSSAEKFFKIFALVMLVYVGILCFVYPFLVIDEYDFIYTVSLIIVMCISFFSQYYFGVVDRLFLSAAQLGYIQYNAQTITLVMSTVLCAIFMQMGLSIHIVKLTTSLIYLIRPIVLRLFVNKKYLINRKIKNDDEPIKQKWNGVAQHVASVVLENTDVVVLTVFSSLTDVSVYSVYHMIVYGVKTLTLSMTAGVKALLGEMWAKKSQNELRFFFNYFEWVMHSVVVIIFTCTAVLSVPFVLVYTQGLRDANYDVPLFAFVLVVANACHCLRIPYSTMIMAGGHYKQTQQKFIISTIINIVSSVVLVNFWGLIGVAIGTLLSMIYQTVWMAKYTIINFLDKSNNRHIKLFLVDVITALTIYIVAGRFTLGNITYYSWIMLAIKVLLVSVIVSFVYNFVFYRNYIKQTLGKFVWRS